jgi:hypothetical protein
VDSDYILYICEILEKNREYNVSSESVKDKCVAQGNCRDKVLQFKTCFHFIPLLESFMMSFKGKVLLSCLLSNIVSYLVK